ncbi:dienelactone hydrolase family protein [Portibacter lacus]|uniref:Carboxymethylenebutenolidase n=1 Tax=Portibacter lacus TaxID=1099794 RepID=A0AA37SQW6_9BACT|nr:dienelactone hydrolase family protein [Portibacter lacus]GLR18235.1 carboxymethylenebutenolidase [Portibacter lacus]
MIRIEKIEYQDSELTYEGVISYDDEIEGKLPAIIIAHAFGGQSQFEENKAIAIAKLGYVGFAIDIYGKGVRAKSPEEAQILMDKLNLDRNLLLSRMKTSLKTCKSLKFVDNNKIGGIGYCFGGKCVLDLVRSGEKLKGIVSFHGVYDSPNSQKENKIETPVLILHGWDDPLAMPNEVIELANELTDKKADWELNAYGHTGHAFTNPKANFPEKGLFYQEEADRKSWNRMLEFFKYKFEK